MQWLGSTYTRRFNLTNKRIGHLFQGRFKNIVVENDQYLLRLSCYIHRNPLRAGIVDRLIDYRWSSYRFFAYEKKPPSWLNTKTILNRVGGKIPSKIYRKKVRDYSDEQRKAWEDVRHGLINGSEDFADKIRMCFFLDGKHAELPQRNSMFASIDPGDLLRRASDILEYDLESADKAKRISPLAREKRDFMIYYLRDTGRFTNREIGSLFNLTYSAVSHRVRHFTTRMTSENDLKKKYEYFASQMKL